MNYPSKQEFDDCRNIAKDIIKEILNQNPPNFSDNLNNSPLIGSLGTVYLGVGGVPSDPHAKYHELEKLSAEALHLSHGITIHCPYNYARVTLLKTGNGDHLHPLERVIYGALVHECTHLFQARNYSSAYNLTLPIVASTESLDTPPTSPHDWLYRYYGQPLEQEAHAAQAAAEVECLAGSGENRTFFEVELTKTEVYRRIHAKMPASSGFQISQWWDAWQDMAYEIYATL